MTTETAYRALQEELAVIEEATGLYLADEAIDAQNVEMDVNAPLYWDAMISAARDAAGFRAAEAGRDVNSLIGRVIY